MMIVLTRLKMKTTKYLYDTEPEDLKVLLLPDALELKMKNSRALLNRLVHEPKGLYINDERINDVMGARKHTQQLINELNTGEINV